MFKYLKDHPSSLKDKWTEEFNGICHDESNWFFTQNGNLWKVPVTTNIDTKKLNDRVDMLYPKNDNSSVPKYRNNQYKEYNSKHEIIKRNAGSLHLGDIDHYKGYIFVPVSDDCKICVYKASDLSYVNEFQIACIDGNSFSSIGWLAINPNNGLLYISDNTISNTNSGKRSQIHIYQINLSGKTSIAFHSTAVLYDESGSLLERSCMQGGTFDKDNHLYITNGYYTGLNTDGPWYQFGIDYQEYYTNDRGCISVFKTSSVPTPSGCEKLRRITHSSQSGDFMYYFKNLGEEPEGITYWDTDKLDSKHKDSNVTGQLHSIVLENCTKAGGLLSSNYDILKLKHYKRDFKKYPEGVSDETTSTTNNYTLSNKDIADYYNKHGGADGEYGKPIGSVTSKNGTTYQNFAGGVIVKYKNGTVSGHTKLRYILDHIKQNGKIDDGVCDDSLEMYIVVKMSQDGLTIEDSKRWPDYSKRKHGGKSFDIVYEGAVVTAEHPSGTNVFYDSFTLRGESTIKLIVEVWDYDKTNANDHIRDYTFELNINNGWGFDFDLPQKFNSKTKATDKVSYKGVYQPNNKVLLDMSIKKLELSPTAIKPSKIDEYYNNHGGKNGEYGTPIGDINNINGIRYKDYTGGVIVQYPDGTVKGHTKLRYILEHLKQVGKFDDGIFDTDLELYIEVSMEQDGLAIEKTKRWPDYSKRKHGGKSFDIVYEGAVVTADHPSGTNVFYDSKTLHGDSHIYLKIGVWDYDKTNDNDHIRDYTFDLNITNGWGFDKNLPPFFKSKNKTTNKVSYKGVYQPDDKMLLDMSVMDLESPATKIIPLAIDDFYNAHGGRKGEFGAPVGDFQNIGGIRYRDYKKGVIVQYPDGTVKGHTTLRYVLEKIKQNGGINDGVGDSSLEMYIVVKMRQDGFSIENGKRWPDYSKRKHGGKSFNIIYEGDVVTAAHPEGKNVFYDSLVLHGNSLIKLIVEVWDYDKYNDNDHIRDYEFDLNINNGWGFDFDLPQKFTSKSKNSSKACYKGIYQPDNKVLLDMSVEKPASK